MELTNALSLLNERLLEVLDFQEKQNFEIQSLREMIFSSTNIVKHTITVGNPREEQEDIQPLEIPDKESTYSDDSQTSIDSGNWLSPITPKSSNVINSEYKAFLNRSYDAFDM